MMTLLSLLFSLAFPAQDHPAKWSFSAQRMDDGLVTVDMTVELDEGWHLYALVLPSDLGPLPTEVRLVASDAFTIVRPVEGPMPQEEYDPNFDMIVRHHSGTTRFTILLAAAVPHVFEVRGEVEYMLCDARTCLPPTVVPFSIAVEPPAQK